ncbi:hypothetical protein ACFYQQ_01135 [Streptomyces sp. NPDC005496]|uniref:hypothetical protein n=1 Tax=unclassified Streptomyces TaxID=2593676 RepID=UPI0033BE927B
MFGRKAAEKLDNTAAALHKVGGKAGERRRQRRHRPRPPPDRHRLHPLRERQVQEALTR